MQRPELAELIERAATEVGSKAELARQVGTTPQRLNDWRTGYVECPPEKVALIADAAKLPADQWLARAVLWRNVGKPDEGRLRQALGKWSRATGGALVLAVCVAVAEAMPHSTMYIM